MWDTLIERIENFAETTLPDVLTRLAGALLIFVVGYKLINYTVRKIAEAGNKKNIDNTAKTFIISFCGLALKILLIITAATILGVPMTSIVAVIGSAGLAIGLALQGGLSNLAGGIILLVTKPFASGDYISIKEQDAEGKVTEIGVMYTTLVTFDNKKVVVPNSKVTSATVIDHTAFEKRRLDLTYSVSYYSDIDKVKKTFSDIAESDPLILKDPEPLTVLEKHGDSALIFMIRWWVKTEDYWTVYFYISEKIKKEFDANGITVPFPQLDVHLDADQFKKSFDEKEGRK